MIWLIWVVLILLGFYLEPWAVSLPAWVPALISSISVGFSGLTQNYARGDRWDRALHTWQLIATSTAALVVYVGWGPVAAVAAALLGDFLFQIGVNLDARLPAIDSRESSSYDLGKWAMKKPFYGQGRYIQLTVAALLLLLHSRITSTIMEILP